MANRAAASKEEGTRDEVQLSKALSKLLRHDAIRMNVAISQEGWVLVSDALKYANQKKRPPLTRAIAEGVSSGWRT